MIENLNWEISGEGAFAENMQCSTQPWKRFQNEHFLFHLEQEGKDTP